jgi:predicted lysophospholipase L1 biosynthesis ABC-type transport system permease subunit
MAVIARQLRAAFPESWTDVTKQGRRITLLSERETRIPPQIRGPALGFVALLMGTVGLVLLVCCANVAGLLLARAAGRLKEVGIRISLGASRGRIVRQMLVESVLLAALGGVVGVAAAIWAGQALMAVGMPSQIPVPLSLDLHPDLRVLAFTLAITLITGVVFGLAPALRASRADIVGALKTDIAGDECRASSLFAPRCARRRAGLAVDAAARRRAAVPENAPRSRDDRSGIPRRQHAAARHLSTPG